VTFLYVAQARMFVNADTRLFVQDVENTRQL
jgi:hypothetical protein